MLLRLLLPSPLGHPYYQAAQVAAFALYVALLLGQGYRRGYPARAWLPLVAAATLGLVLGCQLVLLPLEQWPGWLRGEAGAGQLLATGPRSIIGGAWGSFLVVVALGRVLGLRVRAVLDAFAAPLCWALAAQSVGCVLAGCCWGEATTGDWGVAYGPGSAAFATQLALGLLPAGATHTHPLVPTQLLQLLLCAGAGLALHLLRGRRWPAGSRYLLGLGLLCLGRFAVEFWRDPAGEPLLTAPVAVGGVVLAGLQWLMLAETLLLLGGWAWLVRRPALAALPATLPAPHPATTALLALGLLATATRLAPATLSLPEIAVLQLLLLLVLLAEGHTWLVTLGRGVPRLAGLPLAVLLGGALLLATAQAPAPLRADSAARKTVVLSGGYLSNSHDAVGSYSASGCGGSSSYQLHQQVQAVGAEVALEKIRHSNHPSQLGGGIWVGQQQVAAHTDYAPSPSIEPLQTFGLVDVHLFGEGARGHGWTTVGYRVGLHLGDLGHYSYFNSDKSTSAVFLMPEGMVRLGDPRLLYAQADAGYGAENALGSYATRLALGSGLGQEGGSHLLVGYANAAHNPTPSMGFVSAHLRLPGQGGFRNLGLEPYYATDFGNHHLFSLKLNYRLGGK